MLCDQSAVFRRLFGTLGHPKKISLIIQTMAAKMRLACPEGASNS